MRQEWDKRYSETQHLYGSDANIFIQDMSQRYTISGRTLAIAEGEGRNILYLARTAREKHVPFSAEAWDYSQVALENAQLYANEQGVELGTRQVDLTRVEWPQDQYDNIICVFGHVDSATQLRTLDGVRQALKNHGYFIGEVYSKAQLAYKTGGPGNPDFLYDPKMILDVFKNDHIVHFFVGEVERYEGKLHQGKSHVIQFMIEVIKDQ